MGEVFKKALGDKKGINRNGFASFPMEDVVANVTVDISGRGFFQGIIREPGSQSQLRGEEVYTLDYANHFLEAMAKKMGMNLIIQLFTLTKNPDLHTNLEPIFKAMGKALDQATQIDPRRKGIPSTKGIID